MRELVIISYLSSVSTGCSLPVLCEYVASLITTGTSHADHFHCMAVPSSTRITAGLKPLLLSTASMSLFGSTVIVTGTQRRLPLCQQTMRQWCSIRQWSSQLALKSLFLWLRLGPIKGDSTTSLQYDANNNKLHNWWLGNKKCIPRVKRPASTICKKKRVYSTLKVFYRLAVFVKAIVQCFSRALCRRTVHVCNLLSKQNWLT